MAKKTFKGYRLAEPITIELESPDGERSIEVKCVSSLPGSIFLELADNVTLGLSGMDGSDESELANVRASAAAAASITKVLRQAIVKEDWDRFKAFIDMPENGITVETLAEIAGYVSEQFTNRPPTLAT